MKVITTTKIFFITVIITFCIIIYAYAGAKTIQDEIMEIVNKVEEFKKENGQLPPSFNEIGYTQYMKDESGPYYYTPYIWEGKAGYRVSHRSGIGYDVGTKEWVNYL